MKEITWLIDKTTGQLTVEGLMTNEVEALTTDLLSKAQTVNCARPINQLPLKISRIQRISKEQTLRVYRIYHHSVVEGPGRRSVIQLQGCNLRCHGCYVPETHDPQGSVELTINEVVEMLLDNIGKPRDGITVLGGEPFIQAKGLAALLSVLKECEQHITLYTGYTLEVLRDMNDEPVNDALTLTDILIDGAFVSSLTKDAGEWRGSTNQRIIYKPSIYRSLKASYE